ncbi:hypothetical protein V1525DRAFT_385666 [Lipomyces kononenkoae]|uniref:Uncharacterized protein n=1 Tax=Lipomyces kononenkoae TaxID=34357 RepID=A0ACC3T9L5_LIPKO
MPNPHSTTVSYSFTTESRRHRHDVAAATGYSPPFTTWNLLLYMCLLNPFICLFNICLTLKYVVFYVLSPSVLRSIHQRLTIDDDIEGQAEKPTAAGGNRTTAIADLLGLLAVRHLQNIRVQIAADDGPIDQECTPTDTESAPDPDPDSVRRPQSVSRLSQSASSSSVMSCATNDDDQACLRPPEPAYHDSTSLRASVHTFAPVASPESEREETDTRPAMLEFALPRLLVMHLLAAPVSIALVFAGYATALACVYSICLGESITENDTAGLWRAWARWVVWPVRHASRLQVVPVKHC